MALLDNAVITWNQMEKDILQIFKIVFILLPFTQFNWHEKKLGVSTRFLYTIVMMNNN